MNHFRQLFKLSGRYKVHSSSFVSLANAFEISI